MDFDAISALSRQFLEAKHAPHQRNVVPARELDHRLSVLVGQRGVGKTTLIVQRLLDFIDGDLMSDKILYVPADHFLLSNTSLYDIAEQFSAYGGAFIAFDEIHKYAAWSKEIKSIYDTFPTLKIMASGSSALEMHKGSHDLVRRAIVSEVVGLSFREYIKLKYDIDFDAVSLSDLLSQHDSISNEIIKGLSKHELKVLPLMKSYLKEGYYPYFNELASYELYAITLEQNMHATLESDLAAIYPHLTGASIRKIKQLLGFIAANVPFQTNISKLKSFADIGDMRTVKQYLYYLEQARIIRLLSSASSKLKKHESPEKMYLDNPNQIYALCGGDASLGTIRELFFYAMLSFHHSLSMPQKGDFLVDDKYIVEIGGKKKGATQIEGLKHAFLACDDIEVGVHHKIPLWLFGFLY